MEKIDEIFGPIEEPKKNSLGKVKDFVFKSRRLSLFSIVLIIAIVAFTTFFVSPSGTIPTGNVVMDQGAELAKYPVYTECLPCPECSEINETECPESGKINVFYYVCENGTIMKKDEDCEEKISETIPSITSEFVETVDSITFAIDGLNYTVDEDGSGHIKEINYTIINLGKTTIEPVVRFKMYEEWNSQARNADYKYEIEVDEILKKKEWTRKSYKANTYFENVNYTINFLLRDIEERENIVTVAREIRNE